MKTFLKDPLLHFLGLGLGLLVLFELTGNSREQDNEILIDREALLTFLQYQSVAFDREQFELYLDDMSEGELADLVERAAEAEILYREALALELDRDDYIIRTRLVQKLRYLAEGFADDQVISDADVEDYFEANRSAYEVDPRITFTHVFFNAERRGRDEALRLAEEKLPELNETAVRFDEAAAHGDRFPYFVNYVEAPAPARREPSGRERIRSTLSTACQRDPVAGPVRVALRLSPGAAHEPDAAARA